MKQKIHWSITTKLFVVNLIILAIIGIIITVVYDSFSRVEESVSTIIEHDINLIMENASMGRQLNRIFTESNLLLGKLFENHNQFAEKGQELIKMVNVLVVQGNDDRLQTELQEFLAQVERLIRVGTAVNHTSQQLEDLEAALNAQLAALEEELSERLIFDTLQGDDTTNLTQIGNLIPGFRETLLKISIELEDLKRGHFIPDQETENADMSVVDHHEALFLLIEDLHMRFRSLLISEPEIAQHGEQLSALLTQYEEHVVMLHEDLTDIQAQLQRMNTAQMQVLGVLRNLDEQSIETTWNLQTGIVNLIASSKKTILFLAGGILIVLLSGWIITRWLTRPLVRLAASAAQVADGDIECVIEEHRSRDEIGVLTEAFKHLILYFRDMARAATEISRGNLEIDIQPRSSQDVLGNRFKQMSLYLKDMGAFATRVSQGDLQPSLSLRSDADQLGRAFLNMREGLITLISKIRESFEELTAISNHVLDTSRSNTDALGHIGSAAEVTSSAMREVNASAEEVRLNTEHLTSAVEETSASIGQMITSIKHIAENSRNLSHFADETAVTVVQIVSSLEKVAEQAEHSKKLAEETTEDAISGQQSVEQMITRVTTISDMTENVSTIISRLADRSREIGTILDVINDVADQTSMLALNASIIAAQAGSHGRGFAVVADEIKELATRVESSTREIAAIVKRVQRDSSDAAQAIEQGQHEVENGVVVARQTGEALNKIRQSAGNSSQVAAQIAVSVREQSTTSNHVADSIRDVNNMITEITRATEEQDKNSSQLFTVVENMQLLASQVLRATQEQQQSTHHVTQFMEDVISLVEQSTPTVTRLAESANALASQAEMLEEQMKHFTLPAERSHSLIKKTS